MNRNHTFRRPDRPFALLAVLAFLSGCAFYEGGFAYHVDGRIVDGDGAPLPQRPAMADLRLSATWDERVTFRTDDDGYFALRFMTGLTWGYMKLFNLIPLGSTKGPVPPRAESLHLARSHPKTLRRRIMMQPS